MSRKEPAPKEPEEGSPAAGGCVLVVVLGAPLAAVYAASVTAGVLTTWAVGVAALWRAARSVPSAANPAPPPPPEGAEITEPQFSVVEDKPGHCTVTWSKGATE